MPVTRVRIHADPGGWWAEATDLPGCYAAAATLDELGEALDEAVRLWSAPPYAEHRPQHERRPPMTSAITTEPSKTMHRHEVPIDDQPHLFLLASGPLAVALEPWQRDFVRRMLRDHGPGLIFIGSKVEWPDLSGMKAMKAEYRRRRTARQRRRRS